MVQLFSLTRETKPNCYRWLVELSSMTNNDEVVTHKNSPITYQEFSKSEICNKLKSPFNDPRLVMCRPVFTEEISAGLDISYGGSKLNEKAPEITATFDALYQLKNDIELRIKHFKSKTPEAVLTHIVASQYYDCMSGGMKHPAVIIAREMFKFFNVDPNTKLYPSMVENNDWYTVKDFLDETKNYTLPEDIMRAITYERN